MSNWFSRAFGGSDANKKESSSSLPSIPMAKKPETAWVVDSVILGEYVIERELGRGGMGRVWLVKSNSTGRRFAVKQTLIKDDKHRKEFLTELQTWIDLPEHPNIVPCRFFRTVGDEIVIFADFLEGGSLADWIVRRKVTSLEQILDVAIQFAWGLHAIHERGLIHQDVKPSNVLMTVDGIPMVTDFGLARARLHAADGSFVSPASPPDGQSFLVSSGGMTPAYASPEQRAGQPLSRKTDIWSWGVSVLDMFMGGVSCPHGGHIAEDVLKDFVEDRQAAEGLPDLPADVADVLHKCFLKDPAARWASLDGAAQSLIQVFEGTTGREYSRKAHGVAGTKPPAVQHDRNMLGVQWRDPRDWLHEAYLAAGRDPADAERYQPPVAFSRKGAGVAQLALYEEAERAFERAIRNGHAEQNERLAVLCAQKALICESLGDGSGTIQAHNRCIAIRERLVDLESRTELGNDLATAYMNKAIAVGGLGDLRGAVALYDLCIAIRERLVEHGGRSDFANDLATAYMNKASAVQCLGDLRGAMALYDRCILILERLVEREGRSDLADSLASAYMNKAAAVEGLGDLCGAVELYDSAIAIWERSVEREGGSDLANDLGRVYMNKAIAVAGLGDLRGSVTLYDRCIAIWERSVEREGGGDLTNDLAMVYMNKAIAVKRLGDLREAVALFDCCIAIRERLVEREGRSDLKNDLAIVYMNKANAVAGHGDLRLAVALFDRCISIRKRLVEQENRDDLAGDMAWGQLSRAFIVLRLGEMTAEESKRAHTAFQVLIREAERTNRVDLKNVVAWAKEALDM